MVIGQDDRHPLPREVGEELRDAGRADRIDAGEGLVADEDPGRTDEGAGQLETAALARRELAGRDVEPLGELDAPRRRGDGIARACRGRCGGTWRGSRGP